MCVSATVPPAVEEGVKKESKLLPFCKSCVLCWNDCHNYGKNTCGVLSKDPSFMGLTNSQEVIPFSTPNCNSQVPGEGNPALNAGAEAVDVPVQRLPLRLCHTNWDGLYMGGVSPPVPAPLPCSSHGCHLCRGVRNHHAQDSCCSGYCYRSFF